MSTHKEVYLNHFGYTYGDFISCEVCGAPSVDIHHIEARGMGGTKKAENVENLMAVCRGCHIKYGDKKQYKDYLKEIHNKVLERFKNR